MAKSDAAPLKEDDEGVLELEVELEEALELLLLLLDVVDADVAVLEPELWWSGNYC